MKERFTSCLRDGAVSRLGPDSSTRTTVLYDAPCVIFESRPSLTFCLTTTRNALPDLQAPERSFARTISASICGQLTASTIYSTP